MTTAPLPTRTAERIVTAEEIAAYRDAVRADLPAAATTQASPIHTFVLAHTVADATVRALAANEAEPTAVVHLGQDIRTERPVRPGEHVTITLDVLGVRREARGARVALRTRLTGDDGAAFADLVTSALLTGATSLAAFGEISVGSAPVPPEAAGETTTVTHYLTPEWIHRYAQASGDDNPLHLDAAAARTAGFETVIAHGMSVIALVCEEITDRYADGDASRIRAISGRFSAPVPPGQPLETVLQPDAVGQVVRFTCRTPKGPALKAGWVEITPAAPGLKRWADDD